MNKIITITNNHESIQVECVKQIHTLVSELILHKLKDFDYVNVEDIVLRVLLTISGVDKSDWNNWKIV